MLVTSPAKWQLAIGLLLDWGYTPFFGKCFTKFEPQSMLGETFGGPGKIAAPREKILQRWRGMGGTCKASPGFGLQIPSSNSVRFRPWRGRIRFAVEGAGAGFGSVPTSSSRNRIRFSSGAREPDSVRFLRLETGFGSVWPDRISGWRLGSARPASQPLTPVPISTTTLGSCCSRSARPARKPRGLRQMTPSQSC